MVSYKETKGWGIKNRRQPSRRKEWRIYRIVKEMINFVKMEK